MVAKSVCYLLLFHVFIINGMEHAGTSLTTYDTFTPRSPRDTPRNPLETFSPSPRDSDAKNDLSSVPSLHHSAYSPREAVDLSLDLEPQEEITDLNDEEVDFLVKHCEFTALKDVSERRAKAVVRENVAHSGIQSIISKMRQQNASPDEIHIDHNAKKVRSRGVDLGVDIGDIYKVSHDLAKLMWKKDRTCCGRTISQKKGQKITTYVLAGCGAGLLFAGALTTLILGFVYNGETVNNYYYNCSNASDPYLG